MRNKLIAAAVVLTVTATHAEFVTGNQLLGWMRGNTVEQGLALGYVGGVNDVSGGVLFCAPSSVTLGQVHDMARRELDHSPEERHKSGDVFIVRVMRNAWPCPKKGQSL